MARGLSPNDLINGTITLSPLAVPLQNFGLPLFVDMTPGVVDVSERLRSYASVTAVASDWGTTSGAYAAAVAYFAQNPQPKTCLIGFWASAATPAVLHGGILSSTELPIANFTALTAGAFSTYINGVPKTVSMATLASQTNLNGVAAILQTALQTALASSTAVWNATLSRFDLATGTTGATASMALFTAPTASDSASFSGNATAADTLVVNGTTWTFVSALTSGTQILIGVDLPTTLATAATTLNASADVNTAKSTYSVVGSVLYMVSKVTGTAGNAYTLTKVSTVITVGGATFTGGTGTDASTIFNLNSTTGATTVAGIALETPLACAQAMANVSSDWYAIEFVGNTQPTDAQHAAVETYIEANARPPRIYLYTTQESSALDPNNSSDLGSASQTLNLARTWGQYSSNSLVAAASAFGRMATTNYSANNTVINLMWKQEPEIAAEVLTETQKSALQAKNLNVFAQFQNNTAIILYGKMANGDFIDERIGADWFLNLTQTTLWNVLYQTPTKIPQTDAGQMLLINPIKTCCVAAVNNGFAAPGVWNGPPIGQINTGDALPLGYHVFSDIYANQNQSDREARKAMPIQILLKLSGAVNDVDFLITVNR
jgi:Protein of unknown function (DUF3383)